MKLYKITNIDGKTRAGEINEIKWGDGVTHKATGTGEELCSDGFIHAYEYSYIAVLMNPVHGNYNPFLLWEAEGDIAIRDGQIKCGCKELTTIRQIPIPILTKEQIIEIAIRCAMEVYIEPSFVQWANNWLYNVDRTIETAAAWAVREWAVAERGWLTWELSVRVAVAEAAMWGAEARTWDVAESVTKSWVAAAAAWVNNIRKINLIQIIEQVTGVKNEPLD